MALGLDFQHGDVGSETIHNRELSGKTLQFPAGAGSNALLLRLFEIRDIIYFKECN